MLALGPQASPSDVQAAICDDFASGETTIPIESDAVRLAEAEQGWRFGIDLAGEMVAIAESCSTPTPGT